MLRLSWSQPEDLVPHALIAARLDGCDVTECAARWVELGGSMTPPPTGASPLPAPAELRREARALLHRLDALPVPADLLAREPDELDDIEQSATGWPPDSATQPAREPAPAPADDHDRLLGAWLGRAAGCLLGKPVEKISRAGIRAIAESTGNWPIAGYFTARGLDPVVAAEHPWNRRSAPTSLVENIDGMPEDDDLNFALIALGLVEDHGGELTTERVAARWLDELPAARVFTAERVAYKNLLDGEEPDRAGAIGNPFAAWIGAQIRTDVYGWVSPGDPRGAARLAWQDARLTHSRSGRYGAMFVAAASAIAVTGTAAMADCVEAGLAVIPPASRYAAAIGHGVALARSRTDEDTAIDALHQEFGHLHWVHAINNSALLAFALTRSDGDFTRAVTMVVAGGWDTDSNGATAGALCGALAGATALPAAWIEPLHNRLASSVRGFDGIAFDELARRTAAARSSVWRRDRRASPSVAATGARRG